MRRLRDESGVAVITALLVLIAVLILGVVAIQQATSAMRQTDRDGDAKRALQAAEAGLNDAILQLNRLDVVRSLAGACVARVEASPGVSAYGVNADVEVAGGQRWCRAPVTASLPGGARYEYRQSALLTVSGGVSLAQQIVSTGTSGTVTRRIKAWIAAPVSTPLDGIVSRGPALLDGTIAKTVTANVRSNRAITIGHDGVPAAVVTLAGNAAPGPGEAVERRGGAVITGTAAPAEREFALAPVHMPAADDNAALPEPLVDGSLVLEDESRTLQPGTYRMCRLVLRARTALGGSTLTVPVALERDKVRIFLGHGCPSGTPPGLTVDARSRIANLNVLSTTVAADTRPETLEIYVDDPGAGSGDAVDLASAVPAVLGAVIHAPDTPVTIRGATSYVGAVAGGQVTLEGTGGFTYVPSLANLTLDVLPLYRRERWVECVAREPAVGEAPDVGC